MIKKILFFLVVLFFAYFLIIPAAIQKKQEEFNAAGVSDTSVLEFLDSNEDQDR